MLAESGAGTRHDLRRPRRLTCIRRIDGVGRLLIMQHPAFSQLAPGRRRGGPCERSAATEKRDGRGL